MKNKIIMFTGILSAVVPCVINNEAQAVDNLDVKIEEGKESKESATRDLSVKMGEVINVKSDDSLNIRKYPDADSEILGTVKNSEKIEILGQDSSTGWYKINYKGVVGFVSNRYIKVFDVKTETYTVKGEAINLRVAPDWSSEKHRMVRVGETVEVVNIEGDWTKVYDNGNFYYAPTKYLHKGSSNNEIPKVYKYKVINEAINLRKVPNWSAEKHRMVRIGETVDVISVEGDWTKVYDNGEIVYAPTDYLVPVSGGVVPNPPSNTPIAPPTEESKPEFNVAEMNMVGEVYNVRYDDVLNIRKYPDADSELLTSVKNGTVLDVTGKTSNSWYRVSVNGVVGYANSAYIKRHEVSTVKYRVINEAINLRKAPDWSAEKHRMVRVGETVDVISINGDWAKVNDSGVIVYAPISHLESVNGNSSGNANPSDEVSEKIERVIKIAEEQIGKPYEYGAEGPNSFDCSGLSYYAFKNGAGITLPRVSREQAKVGISVSKSELKRGDLVFFNTSGSGISHLGIYIGNNEMIHAPSSGKTIEKTKMNTSYWNKTYVTARRVIY